MKKISLYMITLLTMVFAACSEDYSTTTSPQSNPQESVFQSSSVTYNSAPVTTIDLSQRAREGVIVDDSPIELGTVTLSNALPSNTILKAKIDIAKQSDFSDFTTIDAESMAATNVVSVLPTELQAAYYNYFTHSPEEATIYMRISLFTLTDGTSEAMIGNPQSPDFYRGNYTVAFTPVNEKGIHISTAYYAVVKGLDGKWTETKFTHSETDVYDDPVFTASIDALKTEAGVRVNTEFFVVAEEDLAAFKAGDLTVAFGKGEGEDILKGGAPFVGPSTDGAAKYNLTLNMEKQTIVIEPEVHLYYYYIYGVNQMKPAEGEEYRNYMFYKTGSTTFTYTTNWQNKRSLKIWEHEDYNKSSNAWGVKSSAFKESGTLEKGALWTIGNEGWYTLTITMDEDNNIHNYQWTAIPEPTVTYTNISIIGTINGTSWDTDFELTQCKNAPHNWYLLDFELTADAKLKFRANKNWDTKDWGGDGSQPISKVVYTLNQGATDIAVPAGKYDFYLNDITGNWTILQKAE